MSRGGNPFMALPKAPPRTPNPNPNPGAPASSNPSRDGLPASPPVLSGSASPLAGSARHAASSSEPQNQNIFARQPKAPAGTANAADYLNEARDAITSKILQTGQPLASLPRPPHQQLPSSGIPRVPELRTATFNGTSQDERLALFTASFAGRLKLPCIVQAKPGEFLDATLAAMSQEESLSFANMPHKDAFDRLVHGLARAADLPVSAFMSEGQGAETGGKLQDRNTFGTQAERSGDRSGFAATGMSQERNVARANMSHSVSLVRSYEQVLDSTSAETSQKRFLSKEGLLPHESSSKPSSVSTTMASESNAAGKPSGSQSSDSTVIDSAADTMPHLNQGFLPRHEAPPSGNRKSSSSVAGMFSSVMQKTNPSVSDDPQALDPVTASTSRGLHGGSSSLSSAAATSISGMQNSFAGVPIASSSASSPNTKLQRTHTTPESSERVQHDTEAATPLSPSSPPVHGREGSAALEQHSSSQDDDTRLRFSFSFSEEEKAALGVSIATGREQNVQATVRFQRDSGLLEDAVMSGIASFTLQAESTKKRKRTIKPRDGYGFLYSSEEEEEERQQKAKRVKTSKKNSRPTPNAVAMAVLDNPQPRYLPCTLASAEDTQRMKESAKALFKYPWSGNVAIYLLGRIERMVWTEVERLQAEINWKWASNVNDCAMRLRDHLVETEKSRVDMGELELRVGHETEWARWMSEAARTGVMHVKVKDCKCGPYWAAEA
ncbi:hypothetical protein BDV95DRAFT_609825 [Massariosphaeria phaeospora]|uniref:Uncharacterized protein n=1 Tax=Massariosphaeria phaeospora TaxID=100035 RepID=A0A7C8M4S7_9PLEO|nr:hypothetical protein BDV95DRAFT_609825 [Massariosphaeria phaeospora]